MITVLISSIGSTGALGVVKALRAQRQYQVRIVGLDADDNIAGRYLVDEFHTVPLPRQPGYVERLLAIAADCNARLLIPIMEMEMMALARNWPMEAACRLACAPAESLEICFDKNALAAFLEFNGFPSPVSYDRNHVAYPAILKPARGTGSRGVVRLEGPDDLHYHLGKMERDYLIQQWLEGPEYSVDIFTTLDGCFIGGVPRLRIETKGGLATKTTTVREPVLLKEAARLTQLLNLRGPANIQAIRHEGRYFFTDVNPRFGGAYTASIRAGLDGPLFLMNQICGDPINYTGYRENLNMLRYWTETYTDGNDHFL